jgi:hypothetical protein
MVLSAVALLGVVPVLWWAGRTAARRRTVVVFCVALVLAALVVSTATLVFGKGGGELKTGRHVKHQDVPMTNLLVSLLDKVGVQVEKLGDSTGSVNLG